MSAGWLIECPSSNKRRDQRKILSQSLLQGSQQSLRATMEEKVVHNDDLNQVENPEESLAEQALGGGMQDVAHISHSMANAYNETIQKADASLLAISPGSKIVDPLDSLQF